jgi:hypothetical protein
LCINPSFPPFFKDILHKEIPPSSSIAFIAIFAYDILILVNGAGVPKGRLAALDRKIGGGK